MTGLLALNTPDSSKVGVVRQMSYNPKIVNTRGMIDTEIGAESMSVADMASPAELLSPFTVRHADPPRQGMQVTQSKHIIPSMDTAKPLFSTGMEKALPHIVSTDFVHKAKQDGFVKRLDEANEIMVIEYKDGSHDVVDLSPQPAKNSNGGFYITNQKVTDMKEGQRFKKNDIVAKNPDYFKGEGNDVTFASGTLAKVALTPGSFTFEDSSMITEELSHRMGSYITMIKPISLGPNANIEKMVKKGDTVKTGDPLLVFENSFDEKEANMLLDRLGEEFDELIDELGRNTVKSKYSGEVVDVKIYYNRDLEEFSPSVQKIIKSYSSDVKRREKVIKENFAQGEEMPTSFISSPTEKIDAEKIKSQQVDGILIEFYVRYYEPLAIGGKLTFGVALKSIVAQVTPKGEEPFSEFRPEEEVSAIISPLSLVGRMTGDFVMTMMMNKALIELKRSVRDIYES
jgi:hypothetical protein